MSDRGRFKTIHPATLVVLLMISMAQLPMFSSQETGGDDSSTALWALEGSEDTGWVTLETIGALPDMNQPGYANWELTFPPGAQISNVGLEIGVDGSNGISILGPELYSPDTQYPFFDWSGLGGFGYQEGFLTGEEHVGRLSPNSDMGAMYRLPDGVEITDLIMEALRPVDPAVSFIPLELDIRDSEVDPYDGRLYIAVGDIVLQLDSRMDPAIIHLREDITVNDIHLDTSMQRMLIVHDDGISAYNIDDGQYLGDLPHHPDLGDGLDHIFTHVMRTTFDLLAISSAGLFTLDTINGIPDWIPQELSGTSEWPAGEPQDVEQAGDILYVSIIDGGVARWHTLWRSSMTPFIAAAGSDFTSNAVHEMLVDSDMLYIASDDAGLFRYNHVQSAWFSPWTASNRLDDNHVIDISAVEDKVFILTADVLHELDSNVGIITDDHDVRTDLSLSRDGVDIIAWPANGGSRGPVSGLALLGDGTGSFSVLDPSVQGLWISTLDLASGPTGMDMTSGVQIGSDVYVSSGDTIDIFDMTSWRWAKPITGIGQDITAMASDGYVLYVATEDPVNLYEMDTSGNVLRIWGSGDLAQDHVVDLVWDDTGYLVASFSNEATVIDLATSSSNTYTWDVGIINDIATRSGIAYLASDTEGVLRIDLAAGQELSPWQSTGLDELSRMPIAAGNGLFYLGVPDYGVLLFNQTSGDVVNLWTSGGSNPLPDDDIRAIHIDVYGNVWIGTSDGATRYDGQVFEDLNAGWDTGDIFYDFESDNDYIWAAMQDDEICRWSIDDVDDRLDCWDDDDGLPPAGSGIWYDGLRFIGQNKLLVMTNNGAAVFDTSSLSVTDSWIPSGGANSAPVVQWDGIVYLGLDGAGIARYDSLNDQWLTTWNNASNMLPDDDDGVLELALDESRQMLWAGGAFGLAQIDLQTGMLADDISQSTNGLNGNSPQKLLIHNDILYYVPQLSSYYYADIARIDLSNNSGLDPIQVGDGHVQSGGDGDGLDAYIHGMNIIGDMMILGVSEAQYQGGGIDYGRILRYNLTNESWEAPWESIESYDRVVSAYIDSHIYAAYDEMVRQIDGNGNVVNEWNGLLNGPIRDIIEFNGEVLFATEDGIARYALSNDTWLTTWNVSNGGLHASVDDEILDFYNYTDGNGDSQLWYSAGVRQGGTFSIPPSVNRITDDRDGDGIVNGSDHDHWETGTAGLPAGDAWSMEVCSGQMHVAIRWSGSFGGGGGVGRYDFATGFWDFNEWTINNGLGDDDVVALACDDQEVIYIGYEGNGEGISRYDHANDLWLSALDNGDGISESAVWYDGMDWLDGVLVAGHYSAGFSTIDASGSTVGNGTVLSAGLEVSSVTTVSNAPFGSGFLLGRPGTDQGSTRLDWYSGGQLYPGEFGAMIGFASGAIEAIDGDSTHIYISPTDSRFDDLGKSILEGVVSADGSVEWTEEWTFGTNTIKNILLDGDSLWITTAGLGLWKLDLMTRQMALVPAGLSTNLDDMHVDGDSLALGMAGGAGTVSGVQLINISSSQWGAGRFIPGMLSNVINDAVVHNLRTWFATPSGVAVWNNSIGFWEESLTVANGLPTPIVDQLYVHPSGELWMATPVGLVRYDPITESFDSTIDLLSGLIGNRVSAIAEDNGRLFLSHNGAGATTPGASVLDSTSITVDYTIRVDQLPSTNILAISADSWGVHIATDADPIVHYNAMDNQFENGLSSWQMGNSTAIDMVSDGADLFILLPDRIVRVDASGITHAMRDEWFVSVDEDMMLGSGGLFAVGSEGMYGWSASPQFAQLERYLLRYADPLTLGFADSTIDITSMTHPGQQIVLASTSSPLIIDASMGSSGASTMPYAEIPVVLTSSVTNAPTYLRSRVLFYSGEWNMSEINPDIGLELQGILDDAISTSVGIDIELRLKSPRNGSMLVRLTYDWTRSLTPVDITDLVDRADDAGGYLKATWTASPDPDFKAYHLYLLSIDTLGIDLGGLTNQQADAVSSSLSTTSLDVGLSLGTPLSDGEEYWGVVFVEYEGGTFGEPSGIIGPAIPLDDVPAAPDWGIAEPAIIGDAADVVVEWSRCTAMDVEFVRIHIYDHTVSDALVVTDSVDIDADGVNSTILNLEAAQAYWLALTCVDLAGQENLEYPLIIGPVIPTGAIDDDVPPPRILDVQAYDTPDDEGGMITVEWTASGADDCALTTVYVMDSDAWGGWDVDPITGQDVRTEIPLTATAFGIGEVLTDCSINSTLISSIDGIPLFDGTLYYFAVVAADQWLNENRSDVEIVEAIPERQLSEAESMPPDRIGSLEAWDTPRDGGTAIQVAWMPSEEFDFSFYVVWANSEPVEDLSSLWTAVGDDQMNCGCIRVNQQYGGSMDDLIEVRLDRARYGPQGMPLTSDGVLQKGITAGTSLHVTVTAHDLSGYVWLTTLQTVEVMPVDNLDDSIAPDAVESIDVSDWPDDDGTAVSLEFMLGTDSDIDQYAVYASSEQFDSVGFSGPADPVAFLDRSPSMPVKVEHLSDGEAIVAGMEVFVAVVTIDSAGNSVITGLITSSAVTVDDRGEDPGAHLPNVDNLRASWSSSGDSILIEWDTSTNALLDHFEVYASGSEWENTLDATLIASIDTSSATYVLNAFDGEPLDNSKDWYIGVSSADDSTHRHVIEIVHVDAYDEGGAGVMPDWRAVVGNPVVLIGIFAMLLLPVVFLMIFRSRKHDEDSQWEGSSEAMETDILHSQNIARDPIESEVQAEPSPPAKEVVDFPGWTQETVDSYLEQGWTPKQLKEWYDKNR